MEPAYLESESEKWPYPFGSKRDILTFLFKQKTKILTVFILSVIALGVWTIVSITYYQASGRFLLKFGRENIYRPEVGDTSPLLADTRKSVESEINILKSSDLVRRVIDAIGVQKIYPELLDPTKKIKNPLEIAGLKFLGKLSAESVEGSNVIEVSFLHENPKIAAEAVNLLIEFLKEKHLKIFSDPKASFLEEQLRVYEGELKESQSDLVNFKRRNNISSSPENQQQRLLNQRIALDTSLKTGKNQVEGLKSKIRSLESQMDSVLKNIPVTTVQKGGNLEKAKADLFDLKRKEQELLTRYTESSSPVMNLRKEIALVEKFLLAEQESARDNTIASGQKTIYQKLEMERFGGHV